MHQYNSASVEVRMTKKKEPQHTISVCDTTKSDRERKMWRMRNWSFTNHNCIQGGKRDAVYISANAYKDREQTTHRRKMCAAPKITQKKRINLLIVIGSVGHVVRQYYGRYSVHFQCACTCICVYFSLSKCVSTIQIWCVCAYALDFIFSDVLSSRPWRWKSVLKRFECVCFWPYFLYFRVYLSHFAQIHLILSLFYRHNIAYSRFGFV